MTKHKILSEHLLRRTARRERNHFLGMQLLAREEGGDWPPTDEPARQAVYALGITPSTPIVVEPERRRFKWAVVAVEPRKAGDGPRDPTNPNR